MTPRKMATWEERDVHTGWRKVLFWQRGELRAAKQRTNRRERREGQAEARQQRDEMRDE